MADKYESTKPSRRRIYKKLDKDSEGFYSNNRTMRTPVNLYDTKPASNSKSSNNHLGKEDSYSLGFWEKRGSRRYQADGSDYRSGYGQRVKNHGGKDKLDPYHSNIDEDSNMENSVVAPVILTRERSTIPEVKPEVKLALSITSNKESSVTEKTKQEVSVASPARPYQIASKPNPLEASILPDQVMTGALKLIDEALGLSDDLAPFLLDQSNFLVVAVVGLQGVGKSTISSLLAEPLKAEQCTKIKGLLFHPESREELLAGCHATSGVDIFITKERVIILDFQPLLSPSVMDYAPNVEKKVSLDYINSAEHYMEIESLQLLTFAMTISHALIVVHGNTMQPNITQMLHTCQMIKPHSNTNTSSLSNPASANSRSGDNEQYFPHLVVVQNMASEFDMTPGAIEEMQTLHQTTLYDSSLCFESQIGVCSGTKPPLSTRNIGGGANYFVIPEMRASETTAFFEVISEMRRQVFSLSRCPLTHLTLTERSWYAYTCRVWESLRKSNLFAEYSRLLP